LLGGLEELWHDLGGVAGEILFVLPCFVEAFLGALQILLHQPEE